MDLFFDDGDGCRDCFVVVYGCFDFVGYVEVLWIGYVMGDDG